MKFIGKCTETKKKILIIIAATAFSACLAVGLGACGSQNAHAHNLTKTYEQAATCGENGNIAYWYCADCGKYFSDENGENEIDESQTVTAATGEHSYDSDGCCLVCGCQLNSEGLTFTLSSGGTYYTLTSIGTCRDSVIYVPETYQGIPVEKIGEYAFINSNVEKVIIGGNVDEIMTGAFYDCTSLCEVALPGSLYKIDIGAFENCSSLDNVTLPVGLTYIGDRAFWGCASLKNISVPYKVTYIGAAAFRDCTSLKSAVLPDGITEISDYLFYGCSSLKTADIPDKVTKIGSEAFRGCAGLTNVEIPGGVTMIGDYLFYGCTALKSVAFSENLTYIGGFAFYGCSSLAEAVIPDSVTEIGSYAFALCENLTSVVLGEGLANIGKCAFESSLKLQTINYNAISAEDLASDSAVFEYGGASSDGITVTIGAKVEKIPAYLFTCDVTVDSATTSSPSVTTLNFADGSVCAEICGYAFYGCEKLAAVILPDSCKNVDKYAFSDCYSLSTVKLSQTLEYIGANSFYRSKISEISIPDSVTAIDGGAFASCGKLEKITLGGGLTSVSASAFYDTAHFYDSANWTDSTYYVGNVAVYSTLGQSTNEECVIKDGTKIIADYAFENRYITSVYIPASVVYIGEGAFLRDVNLVRVTFESGSNLVKIGEKAFKDCLVLTDITLPEKVQFIGTYALTNTKIESFVIPESVTYIGACAFYSCLYLNSVTFENPDGWTAVYEDTTLNLTLDNAQTNAYNLLYGYTLAFYDWYRC